MSVEFQTHPHHYRHWQFEVSGDEARLVLAVAEDKGLKDSYKLKLNSYDLSVDIELFDALERIRFEHPNVRAVMITGALERCFCAGANIFMLGQSSHAFKVNFCKYTNETRLNIEDLSKHSGVKFLCAANGITAGGGYELALACDEILLIDDGSSAVSLPEVPLLGVLPGTGGLTRLVDKRAVRRDIADFFCVTPEGVRGEKAVAYNLVDAIAPKSDFKSVAYARLNALKTAPARSDVGITLTRIEPKITAGALQYQHVSVLLDENARTATLQILPPLTPQPQSPEAMLAEGDQLWAIKAFRELEDAILRLRLNYREIGLWIITTKGSVQYLKEWDATFSRCLSDSKPHWLVNEILGLQRRVFRRLDVTSRSLVALIEPESAFLGTLAELLFCVDQSFMLDSNGAQIGLSALNLGRFPMWNGISRLGARNLATCTEGQFSPTECEKIGLVTHVLDDIDYDDEVRLFVETRASLSPDALSGMEANLRSVGPETMETKIFARLSAWQNWIFIRDNATGEAGALTNYGKPTRAKFDFERC